MLSTARQNNEEITGSKDNMVAIEASKPSPPDIGAKLLNGTANGLTVMPTDINLHTDRKRPASPQEKQLPSKMSKSECERADNVMDQIDSFLSTSSCDNSDTQESNSKDIKQENGPSKILEASSLKLGSERKNTLQGLAKAAVIRVNTNTNNDNVPTENGMENCPFLDQKELPKSLLSKKDQDNLFENLEAVMKNSKNKTDTDERTIKEEPISQGIDKSDTGSQLIASCSNEVLDERTKLMKEYMAVVNTSADNGDDIASTAIKETTTLPTGEEEKSDSIPQPELSEDKGQIENNQPNTAIIKTVETSTVNCDKDIVDISTDKPNGEEELNKKEIKLQVEETVGSDLEEEALLSLDLHSDSGSEKGEISEPTEEVVDKVGKDEEAKDDDADEKDDSQNDTTEISKKENCEKSVESERGYVDQEMVESSEKLNKYENTNDSSEKAEKGDHENTDFPKESSDSKDGKEEHTVDSNLDGAGENKTADIDDAKFDSHVNTESKESCNSSDSKLFKPKDDKINESKLEDNEDSDQPGLGDNSNSESSKESRPNDDSQSSSYGTKRSRPSSPKQEQALKRSRLDEVIGKLGSQIGIKPDELDENVPESSSHSDEEDSASTSSQESDTSSERSSSAHRSDRDEMETETPKKKKKKGVKISSKALEELIQQKMKDYLKAHHENVVVKLEKKIEDLQASHDAWKAQAKELQSKVLEMNIQSQRLRKKQAQAPKVPVRTIGIQINEEKVQHYSELPDPKQKTPQKPATQPVNSSPRTATQAQTTPTAKSFVTLAPKTATTQPTIAVTSRMSPGIKTSDILTCVTKGSVVVQQINRNPPITLLTTSTPQQLLPQQRPLAQNSAMTRTTNGPATVRSLIDSRRSDNTTSIATNSNVTRQVYSSAGNVLQSIAQAASTALQANQKNKVIDLTDEDDIIVNKVVHASQKGANIPQQIRSQQTLTGPVQVTVPAPTQNVVTIPQNATVVYTTQPVVGQQQVAFTPTQMGQLATVVPKPPPIRQAVMVNTATSVANRPPPPLQLGPRPAIIPTHPVPLPATPVNQIPKNVTPTGCKLPPPKPGLKISRVNNGIVLSWNMNVNNSHAEIVNYQLFAYQEGKPPPSQRPESLWRKVGDVKALPLPMACTLTQFQEGNKYHFAVRAVNIHGIIGPFSDASTILLTPATKK